MALIDPTDFEILAFLADHGRNNAVNIAAGLDRNRAYMNTRLRVLATEGYVQHVGPAEHSGLYEITVEGEQALSAYADGGTDV